MTKIPDPGLREDDRRVSVCIDREGSVSQSSWPIPDNDGTVDREEFEAACAKGLVTYTDH
jgi:hypothetical protein